MAVNSRVIFQAIPRGEESSRKWHAIRPQVRTVWSHCLKVGRFGPTSSAFPSSGLRRSGQRRPPPLENSDGSETERRLFNMPSPMLLEDSSMAWLLRVDCGTLISLLVHTSHPSNP
jgi:hypothetical protein